MEVEELQPKDLDHTARSKPDYRSHRQREQANVYEHQRALDQDEGINTYLGRVVGKVKREDAKKGRKSYLFDLAYKDPDGNLQRMKVLHFGNLDPRYDSLLKDGREVEIRGNEKDIALKSEEGKTSRVIKANSIRIIGVNKPKHLQ